MFNKIQEQNFNKIIDLFGLPEVRGVRKSIEEWILIAEKLEKEHNGLPDWAWLKKHGFLSLSAAINRNPENFVHIARHPLKFVKYTENEIQFLHKNYPTKNYKWMSEKLNKSEDSIKNMAFRLGIHRINRFRTLEDKYLAIIDKISKKNNNVCPYPNWFKTNGYNKVGNWIHANRTKIKYPIMNGLGLGGRKKREKATQKYTALTRSLMKKFGYIPYDAELYRMGHGDYVRYIRQCVPEIIKDLPRKQVQKSLEQTVQEALELAKIHGPLNHKILSEENRMNIAQARRKHPKAFLDVPWMKLRRRGICQQELSQSLRDFKKKFHIEKVTKADLRKNGYYWLSRKIDRNPSLFDYDKKGYV